MNSKNVIFQVAYHKHFDAEPNKKNMTTMQYETAINKYNDRKFMSCNKDYNIINYLLSHGVNDNESQTALELEKSIRPEKPENKKIMTLDKESHTKEELKELKEKLRNTDSTIYESIISFDSEFAKQYMQNRKDAFKLLKQIVPKLLIANDFKVDNTECFAVFHTNTSNPHYHLIFWEKEKHLTKNGYAYRDAKPLFVGADWKRKQFLNMVELQAIHNKFLEQLPYQHRDTIRDYITRSSQSESNFQSFVNLCKELGNCNTQYARLTQKQKLTLNNFVESFIKQDTLENRNNEISLLMKKYASSKNANVKISIQKNIDKLNEMFDSTPPMSELLNEYEEGLNQLQNGMIEAKERLGQKPEKNLLNYTSSRINELYNRCSSQLLKAVNDYNSTERNFMVQFGTHSLEFDDDNENNSSITTYLSNEIPRNGNSSDNVLTPIDRDLINQSKILKKEQTNHSYSMLYNILINKGWNPRTPEECKKIDEEYITAKNNQLEYDDLKKERDELIEKNKIYVANKMTPNLLPNNLQQLPKSSPLQDFYKEHQNKISVNNRTLEEDKKVFEKFGITFVSVDEDVKQKYLVTPNPNDWADGNQYIVKSISKDEQTKHYIMVNHKGKIVDYLLSMKNNKNDNPTNQDSLITALKKLGLTTKEIMNLATQLNPNGIAFDLITKNSNLDLTLNTIKENETVWNRVGGDIEQTKVNVRPLITREKEIFNQGIQTSLYGTLFGFVKANMPRSNEKTPERDTNSELDKFRKKKKKEEGVTLA